MKQKELITNMAFKAKKNNLTILIVIILVIVEFVSFFSTDWGKNCRNTIRSNVPMQAAIGNFSDLYTAVKRYGLSLNLKNDTTLITGYKKVIEHVSPEITAGLMKVGIVDMEIYLFGNKLFTILETKKDFDIKKDFERMGMLPRQKEWDNIVSKFQNIDDPCSIDKWKLMECIYEFSQSDINR